MNQINDKPFRIFIPLIISVLELDNAINVMMIICFVMGDASMAYICIHLKKRMRTRIINDSQVYALDLFIYQGLEKSSH